MSDRFAEFLFHLGFIYGSLMADDVRGELATRGVDENQIDEVADALRLLATSAYRQPATGGEAHG